VVKIAFIKCIQAQEIFTASEWQTVFMTAYFSKAMGNLEI